MSSAETHSRALYIVWVENVRDRWFEFGLAKA